MPLVSQSFPPKEDFISFLAHHIDEPVGLADHLSIAGPVANWLRSLGFTDVLVTREIIFGTNQTGFVDFGAPGPEWQRILAAEESFNRGIEGGSGIITGGGMLDRLEDFWYN